MSSRYHLLVHPLAEPKRIANFLSQDKFWVNANLERIRIKDMDLDYTVATMNWLIDRAPKVKFSLELLYRQSEEAEIQQAFAAGDPYVWIKETVLFKKLLQRFDKLSQEYRRPAVVKTVADEDEDFEELAYSH